MAGPTLLRCTLPALLLAGCAEPAQGDAVPPPRPSAPVDVAPADDAQARLQRHLAAARQRVSAPACLDQDQRAWAADTGARCGDDAACLDAARRARTGLLDGLVPGALLDAAPEAAAGDGTRLLVVVGGIGEGADRADEGADVLQPLVIEGVPRATEGGYLLTGPGFDIAAWEDFEALLGDGDGLRARFGDGPVSIPGAVGAFPTLAFDVGDLAAVESAAAAGRPLRVRGWAAPGPMPALDAERCLFVYAPAAAP